MNKIYCLLVVVLLSSCGPSVQKDTNSESYKNDCDKSCLKKYGTHVSYVGIITGTCYCQ